MCRMGGTAKADSLFKMCWKDSGLKSFRVLGFYVWHAVFSFGLCILIGRYSPFSTINTILLILLMETLSRLGFLNVCAFNCVKVVELRKEGMGFRIQASNADKLPKRR
eukprot:TRINITY_DN8796_c0_g1_i2.p2 TRINITY_DN8796_c0_g1~~TRINITY_DN8796_c0_g1_i2.p2  ORF type:complete len:108 (+),score=5.86 TRINITY_DN8796_c0_g1_i2:53-376(+)